MRHGAGASYAFRNRYFTYEGTYEAGVRQGWGRLLLGVDPRRPDAVVTGQFERGEIEGFGKKQWDHAPSNSSRLFASCGRVRPRRREMPDRDQSAHRVPQRTPRAAWDVGDDAHGVTVGGLGQIGAHGAHVAIVGGRGEPRILATIGAEQQMSVIARPDECALRSVGRG
jgi:hypothetical protein